MFNLMSNVKFDAILKQLCSKLNWNISKNRFNFFLNPEIEHLAMECVNLHQIIIKTWAKRQYLFTIVLLRMCV